MVVDPNKYDVSDIHDDGNRDTLHTNDGDHGFVWVTDESAENSQRTEETTHQHTDTASSWAPSDGQDTGETDQEPPAWGSTNTTTDVADDSDATRRDNEIASQWQGRSQNTTSEQDTDQPWTAEASPQSHHDSQTRTQTKQQPEHDSTPDPSQETDNTAGHGRRDGRADDGVTNDTRERTTAEESSDSQEDQYPRVALDPIDYDVEELYTVADSDAVDDRVTESETEAHGFVWSEPPEQHRARIEDPTPEQHKRLLTLVGIEPERVGDKPYLTRISTEAAGGFVVDWLEFLAGEAGTEGAIAAIERYHEIGWFTENVKEDLRNNIRWIDQRDGNGYEVFDRGDHLLSFAYVAKIASVNSKGMVFY